MTDMTMNEILKRYPVGTVLKLTATVVETDKTDEEAPVAVQFSGGNVWQAGWLTQDMLAATEIVNRPIKAGDKVRWAIGDLTADVIYVDGNNAWVRVVGDTSTENVIANIADLELAQ